MTIVIIIVINQGGLGYSDFLSPSGLEDPWLLVSASAPEILLEVCVVPGPQLQQYVTELLLGPFVQALG